MADPVKQFYKFKYASWREDKEADVGFSKELISCDSEKISDQTSLDILEVWPFQNEKAGKVGIQTLHQAFVKNLHKNPNKHIFGTRNKDKYEWKTYREVADEAEHLSYGLIALELVPEVDGLKVIGIRSKNRAEWYISHIANMYQSITTVGIYDNMSPVGTMFIVNETEITTLAISAE